MITNNEVVEVDQNSTSNRQLYSKDSIVPWVADVPQTNTTDKYLALFNTRMKSKEIKVFFSELGISNECKVRDLWQKKDIEKIRDYH